MIIVESDNDTTYVKDFNDALPAVGAGVNKMPTMRSLSIGTGTKAIRLMVAKDVGRCPQQGELMREVPKVETWVVYEAVTGPQAGMRSVCTADDWRVVDSRDPGKNRVIKEGITDENEAEKLARGTSGDVKPRQQKLRPSFE